MQVRLRNSFARSVGVVATLATLAMLSSLAACAPRAVDRAPAAPQPVLLSVQDAEHVARLIRMEDGRALDTALVAALLGTGSPELRARAAVAAGRIRDRHATTMLVAALEDPHPTVRRSAAFALGELGDSAEYVIAALADLAVGPDALVAAEAVAAMGQVGIAAAQPALELLLGSERTLPHVRHAALLAAWRLPRSETLTAAVQRWAQHADAETRWRAHYSLQRIGGPAVVQTLLAGVDDVDERVRANAVRGLRAGVVDSAGLRAPALPALVAAASDPDPHVRINALRLLPGYRTPDLSTPALVGRLADPDANVAMAAAQSLADLPDPAAAAALRSLAADGTAPAGLRGAALASAMRMDPNATAPLAAMWVDSSAWLLRLHASRALGSAGWRLAAAPLQRLARDRHYLVSADALNAIRASADTTAGEARRIFIERLGAAHPLVRAAAARGLERSASAADLDLLLHAYERALEDPVRDAVVASVDALGAVARAGAPVQRVFFARFGDRDAPTDPAIWRAIERRIGQPPAAWRSPAARPPVPELSFYSAIVRDLVAPALALEPLPRVAIATQHGDIVLELAAADAPLTVHNFLSLIDRGYYADTRWHRVVPNFVIQDGDPRGDGSGGPGHVIRDEINMLRYERGTLGMALSGPDTGGSQFFITHSPQPHLDGGYTVFGRVVAGLDVVDRVVQDEPVLGFRRIR